MTRLSLAAVSLATLALMIHPIGVESLSVVDLFKPFVRRARLPPPAAVKT